jgi:hypothetical protein
MWPKPCALVLLLAAAGCASKPRFEGALRGTAYGWVTFGVRGRVDFAR